jgi:glutathione S-transferase
MTPIPDLTLYYHPLSPPSRKVWVTALELDLTEHITLQKVVVAPVVKPKFFPGWSENNELVGSFNPSNKIPTLVVREDGDEWSVYDSKVICEYLIDLGSRFGGGSGEVGIKQDSVKDDMYWKKQTLHRAADLTIDAKILLAYEERIRKAEGLFFQAWHDGQTTKVERGLDVMEKAVKDGVLAGEGEEGDGKVGLEEVAVVSALSMMESGKSEWRKERKGLAKWFEAWTERRSWKESQVDGEWKGKM